MNKILEAALGAAKAGFLVFPCVPNAKRPLTARGLHDATTDEPTIRAWWAEHPAANLAINCGASGIAVIDLDVHDGVDGPGNWRAWCEGRGIDPNNTYTASTPSGGTHLFFRGSCRSSSSRIAPGVDSRGEGGYVLVAPSVIDGRRYRWTKSETLADLPAEVAAALAPAPRAARPLVPEIAATAGSLVELVMADGHVMSRKGALNEWCGPCPWCGGHDRFVVGWDGEGRDGRERYYCRRCEKKGDAVSWLIDRRGVPVVEAKDARGVPVDPQFRRPQGEALAAAFDDESGAVAAVDAPEWARYAIHATEMIAAPPPPVVWDVQGVVESASLCIVYGRPGSLKSMLLADMALAVSSGRAWLPAHEEGGNDPIPVRHVPAAWIDLDNGRRRTHHRVHALAHGAGVDNPDLTFYSFPPCDLTKTTTIQSLEKIILKGKIGVLVIDTLISAMRLKNENDNSELAGPLLALRTLVEVTGCTVIAIHHPRKGSSVSRVSDDLRGGGALAGALDLAIRVEREDKSPRVKVIATKTRGDVIGDLHAEFIVARHMNGDMSTATWVSVDPFESGETIDIIRDVDYDARVLQEIGEGEVTGSAIFRAVKGGRTKLYGVLKSLEATGVITSRVSGRERLFRVKI